ncbi:uncharacterized protein LOC120016922 isoform X1 [Tripterygium wilfordii]|uniref:uncharacterized protein LOC120016922 isoform X1 n=1 Tax=Tripterygium wilfordii TaxID=458696 RepID=UPI0018F7ED98|nr:uncharacterized protein LOC120016922 isoform X1 [Tripterygium wilfordii]
MTWLNLCPLCQSEFQMITCVPVYDTLGSSKNDEEAFSRDDDWCVDWRRNTLSFPSYYIDENLSAWTKVSMQPAEEVMSKVKVVFSTLNSKSNDVSDSEDRLMLENDIPNYSPCCLENHNGTGIGSSPMEAGTKSSVLSESLPKEESGEQPDAECEELYGPDKEPLVNRFPELVEFPAENSIPQDDENHQLNQSGRASRSESEGFRENNVVASAGDDNLIQVRNFRARGRRRYSILTLTS